MKATEQLLCFCDRCCLRNTHLSKSKSIWSTKKHHLSLKYLWLVAPMWVYVPISHQMVAQRPVQNRLYIVAIQTMWWNNICTCRNGIVNGLHQDMDALMHLSPISAYPIRAQSHVTEEENKEDERNALKSIAMINVTLPIAHSIMQMQLTGSNTSIWHRRWTASCVACELSVYSADNVGGFGARLSICDRAPSHACRISSSDGVPSSSVISSNCCTGLCAWNKMRRPSNSPKMHPTDHTSTDAE